MVPHEFRLVGRTALKERDGSLITGVSQSHAQVPEKSLPARSRQRGVSIPGAELFRVYFDQLLGPGPKSCRRDRPAEIQLSAVSGGGIPVPRTYFLADITTEYPVADRRT